MGSYLFCNQKFGEIVKQVTFIGTNLLLFIHYTCIFKRRTYILFGPSVPEKGTFPNTATSLHEIDG